MDWSQYRHHCTWLQTLRIQEDTVVSSEFHLRVSMLILQCLFLPYYYSDLEPVAGWRRYVPFHRGIQVSIDRHFGDSDVNLETFILLFSAHSSTFLSAWETWICRLLPALHAHLPCTTLLLNSEECASEKRRRKCGTFGETTTHSLEDTHSNCILQSFKKEKELFTFS